MSKLKDELKESFLAFLKFGKREHLEALQQGKLYMNSLSYFKKMEKENNNKGMGDSDEASLVLTELDIKMYDNDTGKLVLQVPSTRGRIEDKADSLKPVLCLSYLDFNNLDVKEERKDFIRGNIVFTKEEREEFIKNFGDTVLMISAKHFLSSITEAFEKEGIEWDSGKVKYSNFNINYKDRVEAFMSGGSSKFFWKDIFFSNQKEFRIVILNKDIEEPITIDIGDMTSYTSLMPTEQLFSRGMELQLKPHKK